MVVEALLVGGWRGRRWLGGAIVMVGSIAIVVCPFLLPLPLGTWKCFGFGRRFFFCPGRTLIFLAAC